MGGRGYSSVRAWGLRTLKAKTMFRVSVVCLTLELLIAASTLAPGAPVIPQWPQFALFPLIFVVQLSSILRLKTEDGRFNWRNLVSGVPPLVGFGFIAVFIGAWAVGMSSISGLGGDPTISHSHYYLDNHGSFTPITKAAYEHALVLQQRVFTLGPSMFFAFGVLVHYPRSRTGDPLAAHA